MGRKHYACGDNYVTIDQIPRWSKTLEDIKKLPVGAAEDGLNERVCLYRGDITTLEIDAVVNTGHVLNKILKGREATCLDCDLKRAAGPQLEEAYRSMDSSAGKAEITRGFNLPADYVIHAFGPNWEPGAKIIKVSKKQLYTVI